MSSPDELPFLAKWHDVRRVNAMNASKCIDFIGNSNNVPFYLRTYLPPSAISPL